MVDSHALEAMQEAVWAASNSSGQETKGPPPSEQERHYWEYFLTGDISNIEHLFQDETGGQVSLEERNAAYKALVSFLVDGCEEVGGPFSLERARELAQGIWDRKCREHIHQPYPNS